jgi:hypothetical protein
MEFYYAMKSASAENCAMNFVSAYNYTMAYQFFLIQIYILSPVKYSRVQILLYFSWKYASAYNYAMVDLLLSVKPDFF